MKIKRNKYTVGDLAAFYGVSTDTIRLYDRKGILKAERDNENDYRVYGKSNFLMMDQIMRLRDMGVSLNDINCIVNCNSMEETLDFCEKKLKEYDEEIIRMQRKRDNLENHYLHLKKLEADKEIITVEKSPCLLIRDFSEGAAVSKKEFMEQDRYSFTGEPFIIIYSEKEAWHKVIEDTEGFRNLSLHSNYYMAARLDEKMDYHVSEDGRFSVLPPVMCLHAVAGYETDDVEGLVDKVKNIEEYAQKHCFELAGPACAWSIFAEKINGKSVEYYDLWFPLK